MCADVWLCAAECGRHTARHVRRYASLPVTALDEELVAIEVALARL
jgi:hypothetical protein